MRKDAEEAEGSMNFNFKNLNSANMVAEMVNNQDSFKRAFFRKTLRIGMKLTALFFNSAIGIFLFLVFSMSNYLLVSLLKTGMWISPLALISYFFVKKVDYYIDKLFPRIRIEENYFDSWYDKNFKNEIYAQLLSKIESDARRGSRESIQFYTYNRGDAHSEVREEYLLTAVEKLRGKFTVEIAQCTMDKSGKLVEGNTDFNTLCIKAYGWANTSSARMLGTSLEIKQLSEVVPSSEKGGQK